MSRITKISGVALCLLASMGVLAALAQTAENELTELYVRTTPAGATITVDGTQRGVSPKLFEVKPGDHTVVVKLAGHQPKTKSVTIRDGRIKRVVLQLQKGPDAGDNATVVARIAFGPVIERVVNDDKTGSDWMIDLDTGKVYTPPTQLDPEKNPKADTKKLMAWVRQQGIDATGIKASGGELRFIERVLAVVDKASWESVTQQQVRDALASVVDPSDKALVGDTLYAFRTREGGVGVLQLVGPGDKDHQSVKIRYRLVSGTSASPSAEQVWTCPMHPQVNVPKPGKCPTCAMDLVARLPQPAKDNPQAAKTIFLPDAHTPGVGGVLDLASGEILAIDGEKGFFAVREFTRQYHKGDLYYGYDEEDGGAFVGCLREATAVIWNGKRDRAFKRSQKRGDATVYLLPPLPCRLLITTAEKKVFDVTILSTGKSGEGDMGIPRNISGIRLRYELADPEVVPTESPDEVPEATPADSLTDTLVEQKARDVIAKFAEAVVKGDKTAVTECLHPKMYGMADRWDDAAESVSAGLKLAKIDSVFVRGDRVLVITELATINDRKSPALACAVYTLVKIGESWVIEDIDMEDEKGRDGEIHRFKNVVPDKDASGAMWGKPVNEVQSRLQPGVFRDGYQWLSFDLRNDSRDHSVQLGTAGMPTELLIDDMTYHYIETQRVVQMPVCKPGQRVTGRVFKLDEKWMAPERGSGSQMLELKPGKHTVQAIVYATAHADDPTSLRQTQVLSNPVEIEIVAAEPAPEPVASLPPKLSPRKLFSVRHDAGILAVAYSPDGLRVATVDEQGKVAVHDAGAGMQRWGRGVLTAEEKKPLLYEDRQGRIHTASIAYSPDGYTLAVAVDAVVRLYDAQSGRLLRTLEDENLSEQLKALKRPPATVARELELYKAVPHAHGRTYSVAFSPDGTLLATSGSHLIRADGSSVINSEKATSGKLKLWDVKTGELKRNLGEHFGPVRSVVFSGDGKTLAGVGCHPPSWSRSVRLWDPQTGTVKSVLSIARGGGPEGPVALSPDGKLVAAGALVRDRLDGPADGIERLGASRRWRLLVWNAGTGARVLDHEMPGQVTSLSFSADGKTLAAGVDGQGVTFWDSQTLTQKGKIQLSIDSPRDVQVAFSPTDNRLVVGAKNEKQGFLTVWEVGQR